MAESGGAVKLLGATALGCEELKEKDCGDGAGVSRSENLSFRLSLTVDEEAAAMLWGVGAGAATADGLTEGVKENAEGVSEGGGLEAKEKPTDPEPKGVGAAMENGGGAEEAHVVGTEKLKPDDDAVDVAGAVGTMLNGAAEEAAAGARGVEAANEVKLRFGNVAGADGKVAASLGGWGAKEPGLGSLSPSKARTVGAETSCFTPGLRLSRAKGQSNPSVDSISIVGAGGKVFSSVMWISCWLV